jgi:hypothetical protein
LAVPSQLTPSQSAENETTPTQQPIIQAFSQDYPAPSSSTSPTPTQEPLSQSFGADSPTDKAAADTTSTQQPIVQSFTQPAPARPIPINEDLAVPSQLTPTQSAENETTPTQQPVVQAFSADSSTADAALDTPNAQPSIVQAFEADSPTESASAGAPTQQPQEPVVQAFLESASDESVAEGVTSPEPSLVQRFSEREVIPKLPTVLENLAPLQPLGSSKPLAQQSDFSLETSSVEASRVQPTNLQRRLAEPPPEQESAVPAFFKAAPAESVAAETMPVQESIDQALVESTPAASHEAVNEAMPNALASGHTTPTSSASSEFVAEGTTSTESTLVQAFSETEAVPQLPTVLENLGPLQPLGSSRPLAQQSDFPLADSWADGTRGQPTNLQRRPEAASGHFSKDNFLMSSLPTVQVPPVTLDNEFFTLRRFAPDANQGRTPQSNQGTRPLGSSAPTGGIPSSWSSIDELLGESSADFTSAFGGETPINKKSVSSREPYSVELGELGSLGTTNTQDSSFHDSTSAFSFKDAALDGASADSREQQPVSEVASSLENTSKQEDSQQEDSQNLEILAREIYGLIQQRLAIERERQGGYFSTRLPW